MEKEPAEEVTAIQKMKIAAGLGTAAAGSAVEILGLYADNLYEAGAGLGLLTVGGFYALRQFPISSQRFLSENFDIPFLKTKPEKQPE